MNIGWFTIGLQMLTKEKILELARQKGKIGSKEVSLTFGVSRQYASLIINTLLQEGRLIKIGSTKKAAYIAPEYADKHPEVLPAVYKKSFLNKDLEEHKILTSAEQEFMAIKKLPENIRSILTYAFSEMFNNAIEHSESKDIQIEVVIQNGELSFIVEDSGIGVFRNIMKKKGLASELEAIQELLKGKTTTMPKSHSGEGIFFTSKSADVFVLDSFDQELVIDNKLDDIFVKKTKRRKAGTRVFFKIKVDSKRHLSNVFKEYSNIGENSNFGFDKTEIRVKLYTMAGVHISRSQARRILDGLEKFKIILFDFDKVSVVGQAFADEIFRVFHNKYPDIILQTENMEEGVKFMVERAITESKIGRL